MEMRAKCKSCNFLAKNENADIKHAENHLKVGDFFIVVYPSCEKNEDWYKELKLKCLLCGSLIDPKTEPPIDHIKKHPELFETVTIPKWE